MGSIHEKLRRSAKGQACTMQIPGVCNHNPETTVLAHCPSIEKGAGTKSSDWWAAFACSDCHEAMDNHRVEEPEEIWMKAIWATWKVWIGMGLIILPPESKKRKALWTT